MKIHKIILTIATLTLFTSVLPKVYFDDNDLPSLFKPEWTSNDKKLFCSENLNTHTNFPVLDICIFLDRYKSAGGNPEQWTYNDRNQGTILAPFITVIMQEEAIIASSIFIRRIIDSDFHKINKKILEDLNNEDKWLKLTPVDQEFIVLIPKKKYPNVKTITDIEKIGLNRKILAEIKTIDTAFYKSSEQKQRDRIIKISQEAQDLESREHLRSEGLIKLDTLLQIFSSTLQAKKIMKRVCVYGHGWIQGEKIRSEEEGPVKITKQPTGEAKSYGYVAQLSPNQYVKFLDNLSQLGCSFLYVWSCYVAGWNALSLQNATFYEQQNIFKKFETITEKIPFIIIVGSTPDHPAIGSTTFGFSDFLNMSKFFVEITNFFIRQRNALKKYLETAKLAIPEDKDISETNILTGKFVKQKINYKTEENGNITEKIEEKNISLIEQKPWLINSVQEIINNVTYVYSVDNKKHNLSSVRFPGSPFFRVSLKTTQSQLKELKIKLGELLENKKNIKTIVKTSMEKEIERFKKNIGLLNKNSATYEKDKLYYEEQKAQKEMFLEIFLESEIESAQKDIDDMIKQTEEQIKNIELSDIPLTLPIQRPNDPIKIDYQFLLKQHIETGELKKLPIFETKSPAILIYPSTVNLPIKIINPEAFVMSMIPGRAQHYIKGIILSEEAKKNKSNFYKIFKLDHLQATKLYFIENLSFSTNKKITENLGKLALKITHGDIDYVYKQNNNFYNKSGEIIPASQAWKIIKSWILQTTPAREAIHEATAGVENIYKFRKKINELFKDMFVYDKKYIELEKLRKEKSSKNKIEAEIAEINKTIENSGKNNPKSVELIQKILWKKVDLNALEDKIKTIEPKIKKLQEEVQKLSREGKLLT